MRKPASLIGQLTLCVAVIAGVVVMRDRFSVRTPPGPSVVATVSPAKHSPPPRPETQNIAPKEPAKTSHLKPAPALEVEGPRGKPAAGFRVKRITSSALADSEGDGELVAIAGFVGPAIESTPDTWDETAPILFDNTCKSCHTLREFAGESRSSTKLRDSEMYYRIIRHSRPQDTTFACTEATVKLGDDEVHNLARYLAFAQHRAVLGMPSK